MSDEEVYDVFISYARKNQERWVDENVNQLLRRCYVPHHSNRPAKVFFDREDIKPGDMSLTKISNVIERCRFVVPIFSNLYFQRPFCEWELNLALGRSISDNRKDLIKPIEFEKCSAVPFRFKNLQVIVVEDGWPARLCESLEFEIQTEGVRLEILEQPEDTQVNHTLKPLRVAVMGPDGTPHTEPITLTAKAEHAEIQGPLESTARDGVAEFADLSFGTAAEGVRLAVGGPGLVPVHTAPFDVKKPTLIVDLRSPRSRSASAIDQGTRLPSDARLAFLGEDEAVAVISDTSLQSLTLAENASPRPVTTLSAPPRIIRAAGRFLGVGDWEGNYYLLAADGTVGRWSLHEEGRLSIPGAVDIDRGAIYVGFWSGKLMHAEIGGKGTCLFRHPAGVNALAVRDETVFMVDLDGNLSVRSNGRSGTAFRLKDRILAIKPWPDGLTAIGENRLYKVSFDGKSIYAEDQLLEGMVVGCLVDSNLPVVVDEKGRGIRIDGNLNARSRFHTVAGAIPVASDQAGQYCVLANPDGSHSLLSRTESGRSEIVHSASGAMSVNSSGTLLVVKEQGSLQLIDPQELG